MPARSHHNCLGSVGRLRGEEEGGGRVCSDQGSACRDCICSYGCSLAHQLACRACASLIAAAMEEKLD